MSFLCFQIFCLRGVRQTASSSGRRSSDPVQESSGKLCKFVHIGKLPIDFGLFVMKRVLPFPDPGESILPMTVVCFILLRQEVTNLGVHEGSSGRSWRGGVHRLGFTWFKLSDSEFHNISIKKFIEIRKTW